MPRALVAALAIAASLSVSGCGGAPRARVMTAVESGDMDKALEAYEKFREEEGEDGGLLAHVAMMLLEAEASGDDAALRDAAFSELTQAGTAAVDALGRLRVPGKPLVVRARALAILAKRHDSGARDELRALLDEDDWEVKAAAVGALDATEDADRLVELLAHPAEAVRREAASLLATAAGNGAARAALAEAARVDPSAGVRAACVRALGEHGPDAYEPLRERLSDADASVRLAAVTALVRADRERALSALGPLLEMSPHPAGIEAARVLAGGARRAGDEAVGLGQEGVTLARAYLRRALESAEPRLRSQAAVALSSLPEEPDLDRALAAALAHEEDPSVRLALATLLVRAEATHEAAVTALSALMEGATVPAVHAAGVLAKSGDAAAIDRLAEQMREGTPEVRRVAARALAREAMQPDAARTALRDDDALVRIRAAGGILAAASAA